MQNTQSKIIPNTTQVPHIIIREWMPRLSDVEFRILMVVVDQTLGWQLDAESGRRKEVDWISRSQLEHKTGRSSRQISEALKRLVDELQLIEATNAMGKPLNSAKKRAGAFGQIFYRLTLREPQATLFDKPRERKPHTDAIPERKPPTQIVPPTKDTQDTKENTMQPAEPAAPEGSRETAQKTPKPPSPHRELVVFFYETAKRARGIKPIITAKDGSNLKRVLAAGVSQSTIEQAATFFLYDPSFKKFSPTLSTLLSHGIINGILNRMRNEAGFWKQLDNYAVHAFRDRVRQAPPKTDGNVMAIKATTEQLTDLKTMLANKFAMPKSYIPEPTY